MEPRSDKDSTTFAILHEAMRLADTAVECALGSCDPSCLAVMHHVLVLRRDSAAISLLCREGYSDSALLQLRRVWETSLRLQFILLDPALRAQEFVDESLVKQIRTLRTVAQSLPNGDREPFTAAVHDDPRLAEKQAELKALAGSVSGGARARASHPKRIPDLWPIGMMADAVGRRDEYDYVYTFLSDRSHGGPDVAKDLLAEDESGGILLQVHDYSEMCIGQAASWLLYGTDALLQLVAPDKSGQAKDLFKKLEQAVTGSEP